MNTYVINIPDCPCCEESSSSSSSSSTSGSEGSTSGSSSSRSISEIVTPCCPDGVPSVMYATIVYYEPESPDNNCPCNDGSVIPLTWDAGCCPEFGLVGGAWVGTCGTMTFYLYCNSPPNNPNSWTLRQTCPNPPGPDVAVAAFTCLDGGGPCGCPPSFYGNWGSDQQYCSCETSVSAQIFISE